jgi:hypothetical protein
MIRYVVNLLGAYGENFKCPWPDSNRRQMDYESIAGHYEGDIGNIPVSAI